MAGLFSKKSSSGASSDWGKSESTFRAPDDPGSKESSWLKPRVQSTPLTKEFLPWEKYAGYATAGYTIFAFLLILAPHLHVKTHIPIAHSNRTITKMESRVAPFWLGLGTSALLAIATFKQWRFIVAIGAVLIAIDMGPYFGYLSLPIAVFGIWEYVRVMRLQSQDRRMGLSKTRAARGSPGSAGAGTRTGKSKSADTAPAASKRYTPPKAKKRPKAPVTGKTKFSTSERDSIEDEIGGKFVTKVFGRGAKNDADE